jgi:heme/copper-type cytochrome/quinol oxidase subunit 3
MWWFLGSETITFGGVLVCFILYRLRHPEWGGHAAHTIAAAGAFNTLVLLTSSLMVVLAHQAAQSGNGAKAARFLWITLLLGGVFIAVKAYEYSHKIHEGIVPTTNLYWSFYYFMTGLHALHVLVGLLAIGIIAVGAGAGRNLHRVEVVGIYWHFVDLVWIFLFPLLYVSK